MKKQQFKFFLILFLLFPACSSDYLETQPTNQVSDKVIYSTVDGAQTLIDGVLRDMRSKHGGENIHDQFGVKAVDLAVDLMGEDIVPEKFHWFGADYRLNNRSNNDMRPNYVWKLFYRIIFNVNGIINHVDEASAERKGLKNNLKAQALTLRAYSYFQLIQLFQHTYLGHENDPGVPVYTDTAVEGKPRSTVAEVYSQITSDLEQATRLFDESGISQRHISNPTGHVARGIWARVALVMNDWEGASSLAAQARNEYSIMNSADFAAGFDDYREQNWMWGFEINNEQSTTYASWFSHMDWTIGGYCGYGFSPKSYSLKLYNTMVDEDIRKQLIDTSSVENGRLISYKFAAGGGKEFAADYVMMRPEEMWLIEAEAKARLGDENAARALLKEVRDHRYDTPAKIQASGSDLINQILLERRIELWGEGFAGFDIKRLKRALDRTGSNHDPVVASVMTLPAESNRFVYQIPQQEIDANGNIGEQDQNL